MLYKNYINFVYYPTNTSLVYFGIDNWNDISRLKSQTSDKILRGRPIRFLIGIYIQKTLASAI